LASQRLVNDSRSLDFAAFYTGAAMLGEFPGTRLYDLSLQLSRLHKIVPMMDLKNYSLQFLNPPFFALLFWPLTRLSLAGAYAVWTVINLALLVLLGYLAVRELSKAKFKKKGVFIANTDIRRGLEFLKRTL
jgi:multidrug transporter EmrE-like cation transporter